jgi:hypothetical protein
MRPLTSRRLRAAYYARYSTDGQEADSIDRQFMVCEAIAKREGFTHINRHRFSDPETSGGTPRRIGYSAMLAAAIRGEFDILVAEDISRLWRNMEMQTRDINELLELRISIVTQAEDIRRENDLMMLNLKGSMNENIARRSAAASEIRWSCWQRMVGPPEAVPTAISQRVKAAQVKSKSTRSRPRSSARFSSGERPVGAARPLHRS